MKCHVPISAVVAIQCILVFGVFATLIAVFSTQMASSTEDQVEQRLTARLSTIREAILKPFVTAQTAGETLVAIMQMDQSLYRVTGRQASMMKDGRFLRLAGALAGSSNGFIQYITQVSDDGVTDAKGTFNNNIPQTNLEFSPIDNKTYLSALIAQTGLSIKISKNVAWATAAATIIPESLWSINYNNVSSGQYGGPYSFSGDSIEPRLNDSQHDRYWTTFANPNDGRYYDFPYSLLSAYTIVLEQSANMSQPINGVLQAQNRRFPNTWLLAVQTDLLSIPPILRGLVEGHDSVSAVYEVQSLNKVHNLVSTASLDLDVISPSGGFYPATATPDARLNEWYAAARQHSSEKFPSTFPDIDAMKRASPTLTTFSYNISTDITTSSASFRLGDRFVSYVHIYLAPPSKTSSSSSTASTTTITESNIGGFLHFFAIVSTPSDFYFGDQIRTQNMMIGVGIAFAIIIALFCLGVVVSVYIPLKAVRANMSLAAQLKNDQVSHTASPLTEIDQLCAAFGKMNKILLEARAFMPASMLVRTSDDDDPDDDGGHDNDNEGDDGEEEGDDDYSTTNYDEEGFDKSTMDDDDDEGDFSPDSSTINSHSSSLNTPYRASSSTIITDVNTENSDSASPSPKPRRQKQKRNSDGSPLAKIASGSGRANNGSISKVNNSSIVKVNSVGAALSNNKRGNSTSNNNKRSNSLGTNNNGGGGKLTGNGISQYGSGATILRNRRVAVLCVNVRGFTTMSGFSIDALAGHSKNLTDAISLAVGAERGVIDSFHGDHFVISFNAVKAAASPAKKATLCALGIASSLQNTPYACLSMGASSGSAIVGPLGNSAQRRLSIVGPCYVKALRLQRASALMERAVDPLFFVPAAALTAASAALANNNAGGVGGGLGAAVGTSSSIGIGIPHTASSNNLSILHRSKIGNGGNSSGIMVVPPSAADSTNSSNNPSTSRQKTHPNCFYCLIDKTSYAESRDVADTLLVGSLSAPIRTRTLANVMNKMANLFNNGDKNNGGGLFGGAFKANHQSPVRNMPSGGGGGGAMAVGNSVVFDDDSNNNNNNGPSSTTTNSSMNRFRTLGGNGIQTVNSMSMNPTSGGPMISSSAATTAMLLHSSKQQQKNNGAANNNNKIEFADTGLTATVFSESILYNTSDNANAAAVAAVGGGKALTSSTNKGEHPNQIGQIGEEATSDEEEGEDTNKLNSVTNNNNQNQNQQSAACAALDNEMTRTTSRMTHHGNQLPPLQRIGTTTGSVSAAAFARQESNMSLDNHHHYHTVGSPSSPGGSSHYRGGGGRSHHQTSGGGIGFSSVDRPMMKKSDSSFFGDVHSHHDDDGKHNKQRPDDNNATVVRPRQLISLPATSIYAVLKLSKTRITTNINNNPNFSSTSGGGGGLASHPTLNNGDDHDEWMYVVQKKNENDVYKLINSTTEALQRGDVDSALAFAEERMAKATAKWESERKATTTTVVDTMTTTTSAIPSDGVLVPLTTPPREVTILQLFVSALRDAINNSNNNGGGTLSLSRHHSNHPHHPVTVRTNTNASPTNNNINDDTSSVSTDASFHRQLLVGAPSMIATGGVHTVPRPIHGVGMKNDIGGADGGGNNSNAFGQPISDTAFLRPEELLVFFEGITLASIAPVDVDYAAAQQQRQQQQATVTATANAAASESGSPTTGLGTRGAKWNSVLSKLGAGAFASSHHHGDSSSSAINPQLNLPPLTNIEAAELAAWLRLTRIIVLVGCGGKPFVTATSFL